MKLSVLNPLLLSLGVCAPLFAIERPPSLDEKLPKAKPRNEAVGAEDPKERGGVAEMPRVEVRPAWLGVFSETADETLSTQLGVDGGVVLRLVADGSPAEKAGLQVHDLLTTIDGEGISSQDELRAAVGEHKPGDEIKVGVVSRGKKEEKVLKLGERPVGLLQLQDDPRFRGGDHLIPGGRVEDMRRQMENLQRMFPNPEFQKRMKEEMKDFEEQLKNLEKMPGLKIEGMELELDDLLDKVPNQKNGFKFNMKSMGSVKLMDKQGSVEMKMRDGGHEVKVRDKDGKVVYEGPWDNAQDKAAAPPEIRERIEKLNIGMDGKAGGIQLRIGPGGKLDGGGLRLDFDNRVLPMEEENGDKDAAGPDEAGDELE